MTSHFRTLLGHYIFTVSIKLGLRIPDCGLRTACRLGITHGLGIKCGPRNYGLNIEYGLGIKRGLRAVYIKTALER